MAQKFTRVKEDAFQTMQLNAGILLDDFDPSDGTFEDENILGATSGGTNFTATPEYEDFGEDVDNCPINMKEFKQITSIEVLMSGTFVTVTAALAQRLVGAADIATGDNTKIVPRNTLKDTDFKDLWWVGDYSDKNGATNGGFVAIHMLNSLSTGGFQIQSGNREKGQFAYEFTGHYSLANQDQVPFEVYVKAGSEETA